VGLKTRAPGSRNLRSLFKAENESTLMPASTSRDGNEQVQGALVAENVSGERVRANLLRFGRRLRAAGMPVGSGQVLGSVEAMAAVEVHRRDDVYSAAKATLVTSPQQIPIFDAEFSRFWRDLSRQEPLPLEQFVPSEDQESLGLPQPPGAKQEPRSGEGRTGSEQERTVLVVEGTEHADESDADEEYEVPPEDVLIFSAREALRKKDFSQLTPEELAEARRIIEGMNWRLGTRQTRRRQRAVRGDLIDYRQTLRGSLKHGGMPVELRWRKRKERMRPLVLICDISGSMDRYARLLLRFVHALEHGLDGVEVFVFGTRLTRITRELRRRDVDQAIEKVVASVDDWSGGTRIGEAIKTFNFRWSRRVLRSGATVVVISDGWDRGDPVVLGQEMARLQRSSRRLIWLNPLLGAPGYQPLTQGIRAALPYVDHFLPVHNLRSLEALAALLSSVEDQPPVRRQISSRLAARG
jgi:uncharacterized protein with von Willebrand factor type A (vWA) domain